jgi:hypothetical protein
MSVVYLAEDQRLGRQVAIKVLAEELAADESFRTRFIRESQLAAGLEHPNIVPVYEAGEQDGHLFIAMRYVRGTDLRTVIMRDGPLSVPRVVALIRPVAGALDTAHRRGLVHRDVKPANILVAVDEGEELPYLADFGLSKHTASKSGLTKTGTFMGTVDYVAPEQIKGEEVDGRTDEYSLACVLYQCLTKDVPFEKDTDIATMFSHLQDPPPSLAIRRPDLPPGLQDAVSRGMAKERDDRFPTCTAMMDAFGESGGVATSTVERPSFDPTVVAMAPQPGSQALLPPAPETEAAAPPSGETGAAPAPARSRRGLVTGLIAAAVVAAVVGVIALTGGGDAPSTNADGPTAGATAPTGVSRTTGATGSGALLFSDDFSDPSLEWLGTDPFHRASMEEVDGTLFITLETSDAEFTTTDAVRPATAELPPIADVRVETLATMVSSTPSSAYGVVCRSPVPNEYYWFLISPNGDFSIGKRTNDGQKTVSLSEGRSSAIETGTTPNLVAAECQDGPNGSTVALRMFVNGVAVASVVDTHDPLGPGLIGIIAEEYGDATQVAFDEFSASAL